MRGSLPSTPATLVRVPAALLAVVLCCLASGLVLPQPAMAKDGWTLTGVCTPVESYPEFRLFRVTNDTGAGADVELRNPTADAVVEVFAPPGESFHLVPAKDTGSNLTQLWVDGKQKDVDQAVNVACAVLQGSAVCVPERGEYDVTWTVTNNDSGAHPVLSTTPRPLAFAPDPVPADGGKSRARESAPAPQTGSRTLALTVVLGLGDRQTELTAEVVLGQCSTPLPPEISFTFDKTASVAEAGVGDTVTYTYAGTNTGEVPLEVTQLVDDRLGILISDPAVETVVPPGGSISRQVTYTVTPGDGSAGSVDNAASVTVRPTAGPDQTLRTATAEESVRVRQPPQAVLTGEAECDPNTQAYEVTWSLQNTGQRTIDVIGSAPRNLAFTPGTLAPGATAVATETISPTARALVLPLVVDLADTQLGDRAQVRSSVQLGVCAPPAVGFTFSKSASVESAGLGDTIAYTYAGTNTGEVPLEVTQLVDDRLGVVLSDPAVETVVPPGATLERTIQYVVTADDVAAGVIANSAVVTVRPTEGPDLTERSAEASAQVRVVQPPPPIVADLSGTAACDPATGSYDITWSLANAGRDTLTVTGTSPRTPVFAPLPIAPGATATATETVTPTGRSGQLSLSVTVDDTNPGTPSAVADATVTLGECAEPLPPVIAFTFTKTADEPVRRIGQTITYTYAGTNTGKVALEVTQLVDDRLGVLLRGPETTTVRPGESLSRQVTHVVTALDASAGNVRNAAVVNVRAEGSAQVLSAVARRHVRVLPPPTVAEPALAPASGGTTAPSLPAVGGPSSWIPIAGLALLPAGLVLALGGARRRRTLR